MHPLRTILILALCLAAAPVIHADSPEDLGREIMVRATTPVIPYKVEGHFTQTWRKADSQTIVSRLTLLGSFDPATGLRQTLLAVESPGAFQGAGFLIHSTPGAPDRVWYKQRESGSVTALNGGDGPLVVPGLDLEMDLEHLFAPNLAAYRFTLVDEQWLDDTPCWVIERTPLKSLENPRYGQVFIWVAKPGFTIVQELFHSPDLVLVKSIRCEMPEKSGDQAAVRSCTFLDLRSGASLDLRLDSLVPRQELDDEYFSLRYFINQ